MIITMKVSKELKKEVFIEAQRLNISASSFIKMVLSEYLGRRKKNENSKENPNNKPTVE
jgi:hypothetical protein